MLPFSLLLEIFDKPKSQPLKNSNQFTVDSSTSWLLNDKIVKFQNAKQKWSIFFGKSIKFQENIDKFYAKW